MVATTREFTRVFIGFGNENDWFWSRKFDMPLSISTIVYARMWLSQGGYIRGHDIQ